MADPRIRKTARGQIDPQTGNVILSSEMSTEMETAARDDAPVQLPPEELQFAGVPDRDDIHGMLESRTMISSLDPATYTEMVESGQDLAAAPALAGMASNANATIGPASQQPVASGVAKVPIRTGEVPTRLCDPRLIMLNIPDSVRAASFRVLRHRLVERGHPRTIVVTSAEARDGKTTCAANLAIALSEFDRARVLLLEANLRSPGLAELLGMRPPVCLVHQLASHKQQPMAPWDVAPVITPLLHTLVVDPSQFKRPRVIDGPAMELAISQLKRVGYDYIVIDTPPVLGHADVNLLQDCADGVVFSMQARKSSNKALRRAIDQLTPAKVLGVVMLDV